MDLLNLRALLTLDKSEYEKGLTDAENEASGFGSKFKSAMGTAAKAGAAAMAASASAVALLGKNSIGAYADTQQLVGGVQKLYGNMGMSVEEYAQSVGKSVDEVNSAWQRNEQAQNIVLQNAKNAFQTAGLSYNDYMEQATSFSAALINSLDGDTVKAAQQTDVAMRAIADNYNTFGGDMENIQYAFQGFAKQNYTMLDNLKLGYGGTKTEMERLIADANEWGAANGKASDLSIDSFSDVVTAIEYIQEKQGIAGTTAREAATTIAGSIGMVKASWANLMAGLADPDADISELTSNLVESVATAGKNLLPAIEQFGSGFGTALEQLAPQVIEKIPTLIQTAVPALISSAQSLITVLVQSLTTAVPQLLTVGVTLVKNIVSGMQSNASSFITSGLTLLQSFASTIISTAGQLIPVALTLIRSLATGIASNLPTIIQTAVTLITSFAGMLAANAPKILQTGVSIIVALVSGIVRSIPVLIASIPTLITAIVGVFTSFNWISLGTTVIKAIAKGLTSAGSAIKSAIKRPIDGAKDAIVNGFNNAKQRVAQIFNSIKHGISEKINSAKDTVKAVVDKISGFFPLKIGKIFSGMKLPHFSVSGSPPFGIGGKGTKPSISVSWYKKAMENPYLFSNATLFGAGEAGDEILYGRDALMKDIAKASESDTIRSEQPIIVNLNYDANDDANDMIRDVARGLRRHRMAGAF